jgi:hypothetical protein
MKFILLRQIVFFFIWLSQLKYSQSEYIYNNTNYNYQTIIEDNITITQWEGVSADLLLGRPYIECIETSNTSYYNHGYVNNGEIRLVLYRGEMQISKKHNASINVYKNIGERYLSAPGQYMYIEIKPNSVVFIIGSKYELINNSKNITFYNNPYLDADSNTRAYLMSNMDIVTHDIHLNEGKANATDYMWNSTLFTSPWTLIELYTPMAYVLLHEHPLGVVYFLFEGCMISFCYSDDDCIVATDGMIRYETYGVIYREIVQILPGYDRCLFGVEEFYYNYDAGQPIFYNNYTDLDNTISVTTPLRTITTL